MSEHTPQSAEGICVPMIRCDGAVCVDSDGHSYVATADAPTRPEQRRCVEPHFYTTIAPGTTDAKWWRERRYCRGPKR